MRRFITSVTAMMLLAPWGLSQETSIHSAVKAGDVERVKALLAATPALASQDEPAGSGLHPLHLAAGMNKPDIVKVLIDAKADINARTRKDYTPLHLAARVNAVDAARVLVEAGADLRAITASGESAYQMAIRHKSVDVVKLLSVRTGVVYQDINPMYAEGEKARAGGDLDTAYEIFSKLLDQDPGNPKLNFAYAMVCMQQQEYTKATMAFERILLQNPMNDRARFEMARCYAAQGQPALAQRELETILSHEIQPGARNNVEAMLRQIMRMGKKWYFSGRLDLGWTEDSNVNVGPDQNIIGISPISLGTETLTTLTVEEGTQPLSATAFFGSIMGSAAYDGGRSGAWMITADAAYYQNVYPEDGMSKYESSYLQGVFGLRNTGKQTVIRLPVRVSHITRGGESMMDMGALIPRIDLLLQKGDYMLGTEGVLELRDWATLDDRDSTYAMLQETLMHVVGKNRHMVTMGLGYFRDDTEAPEYANTGLTWSFNGTLRLPSDVSAYGSVRYTTSEYDEREALAPQTREDSLSEWVGGIRWQPVKWFGIDGNFTRSHNNSNFGLYQYDRDVTSLSVYGSF